MKKSWPAPVQPSGTFRKTAAEAISEMRLKTPDYSIFEMSDIPFDLNSGTQNLMSRIAKGGRFAF